jgi:hypothetical protein
MCNHTKLILGKCGFSQSFSVVLVIDEICVINIIVKMLQKLCIKKEAISSS